MNKMQLLAMWAGIAALVLRLIFPPLTVVDLSDLTNTGSPMTTAPDGSVIRQGYHPLVLTQLNVTSLVLQAVVIVVITFGMIVSLRHSKPMKRSSDE